MDSLEATRTAIRTILELPPFYKRIEFYSVLVALAIGIAGIFREWILDFIFHPKLKLSLDLSPPDSIPIPLFRDGIKVLDSYYYRIKVTNSGSRPAKDVELLIENLFKKKGGKFKKISGFVPLKLIWSNTQAQGGVDTLSRIQSRDMFEHCNLGHIEEKELGCYVLKLDTKVNPTNMCNCLTEGVYRFHTITSANNVQPFKDYWELVFDGALHLDEKEQFEKGVLIKKL